MTGKHRHYYQKIAIRDLARQKLRSSATSCVLQAYHSTDPDLIQIALDIAIRHRRLARTPQTHLHWRCHEENLKEILASAHRTANKLQKKYQAASAGTTTQAMPPDANMSNRQSSQNNRARKAPRKDSARPGNLE